MKLISTICVLFIFGFHYMETKAAESNKEDEPFDPAYMIMHHIEDAHDFHILSYTNAQGEKVDINFPLPVILWHNKSLHFFMSWTFRQPDPVVPFGDTFLRLYHEKIYYTDPDGTILYNENGTIANSKPLSFSITKNVFSLFVGCLIIFWIFGAAAKRYSKRGGLAVPKGIQLLVEPIILFVRDDIIRAQIDKEKADKFTPYLLTLFFFIWINNLVGLIPFFPGSANLSGNISFTMTLAVISFLAINVFGSKHYWKHLLIAPGVPFIAKIFLIPVEIVGIFTKPFGLMLRLFANITAGHIIILAITAMIFIIRSFAVAPMTILLSLIMISLEFLVAILQAYIFTLLTSLFIGMAVNEEH
ncbi:F0F1 ATP synthase subunit A [Alkalitalea saponilacus]|uniref:ATP synthase subunit a n=1 Tax=Alkalitalea saponilacus TaxID=889453 RepID=A0A1T5EE61_9BACT|nr:F0F1 ATP synthase subunit A [Alkalitalea saponilacus]ASB49007.1 ATP synthase F0 subunit A [Alkalitalea saponilacus]SKB82397.1 F-type H+-transporting ATPase subunit a [Alkalitalea saponilacus]